MDPNVDPSTKPTTPPTGSTPEQSTSSFDNKKWLIILFTLLLVSVIAVGAFTILRQRIQQPDTSSQQTEILATIGSKKITIDDVRAVAREQYQEKAITQDALKIAFEALIERTILDLETEKLPPIQASSAATNEEQYQVKRDQVIQSLIASRDAYSIGFYIPPENYGVGMTPAQEEQQEQQRIDGPKALDDAEERLREGDESAYEIAQSLIDTYPSLEPIMAVNAAFLSSPQNQEDANQTVFTTPQTYVFNKENTGDPFIEAIYSMKENEVKQIAFANGNYAVIKVVKINFGDYKSYNDWLDTKKKALVTIHRQP